MGTKEAIRQMVKRQELLSLLERLAQAEIEFRLKGLVAGAEECAREIEALYQSLAERRC